MWDGTITPQTSITDGQLQGEFRAVMAGSNAYVKDVTAANDSNSLRALEDEWTSEEYENGAAIEAPLDCNGNDTYMGMSAWDDGKFDAQRCIEACKAADDHDLKDRTCNFVNTYMQRQDGVPVAQHCAMFSEYWPAT